MPNYSKDVLVSINTEELFRHANKTTDDACWLWTGKLGSNGHPRFYHSGNWYYASKLLYNLVKGDIPEGEYITATTCKNLKGCVNPHHAVVGKHKGNKTNHVVHQKFGDDTLISKENLYKGINTSSVEECWIRDTGVDDRGYSRAGHKKAHRVAYELEIEKLSEEAPLYRICDGPNNCINPYHWTPIKPLPKEVVSYKKLLSFDTISIEGLSKFNNSYIIAGDRGCWISRPKNLQTRISSDQNREAISIDGVNIRAYRLSAFLHKGPPPEGKDQVRHLCNIPACCNPFHLEWGTAQENADDRKANYSIKGYVTGANNPRSKFKSDEAAAAAWEDVLLGISDEEISNKYSVSPSIIRSMRKGESWNHITGLEIKYRDKRRKTPKIPIEQMTSKDIINFWNKTKEVIEIKDGREIKHLEWQGAYTKEKTSVGVGKRGSYHFGGKSHNAYHIAYFLMNGHLPKIDNFNVMRHLCGNSLCVKAGVDPRQKTNNPERFIVHNTPTIDETHIIYGTKKENAEDLVMSGYKQKHQVVNRVVPIEKIAEIGRLSEKKVPATEIARILDLHVVPETINKIIHKESEKKGEDRDLTYRAFGEDNPITKVTDNQIFEMRRKRKQGISAVDLAAEFNLSRRHVDAICYGQIERPLSETSEGYEAPMEPELEVDKKPVTRELKDKVKELYKQNKTAQEISNILGEGKKRCQHIITKLQKAGELPKKLKRTQITPELKQQILDCYLANKSPSIASTETGLALSTIEKHYAILKETL